MEPRIDREKVSPEATRAMYALETYDCGLEKSLLELVKVRARLSVSFRAVPGSYQPRA